MDSAAHEPCCPIPCASSRRARPAGFSLVELVIVVMIMSILAAIAIPTFVDSLLFHRVETAARRVKADLEMARSTARLTSTGQTITYSGTGYTASAAVKNLDRPSQTYTVQLEKPPYEIKTVTPNFGTAITFDGYGKPNVNGKIDLVIDASHKCTVWIDTNGHIRLESGSSRSRVTAAVGN